MLTSHKKYDGSRKYVGDVGLSLHDDESFGTRKFFALSGPILDSLENGYTLVADELDSKLHPNLVCKLVALFNSKNSNPKNAQLIFNTHDTNLLSAEVFRKDQVWFTEKDKYGEAKLYALSDFRTDQVRKNEAFEENYIRGKYGAVPFLGFFDDFNLKSSAKNEGKETEATVVKTKAKRSTKSQSASGAVVRSTRRNKKSEADHIDRL
jgi:AAA15 family ATPase/GTPase